MPKQDTRHRAFNKENFQTIWPVHVDGFARLLLRLRRQFDGDLDLLLIVSVVSRRTLTDKWAPQLVALDQMIEGADRDRVQQPINIHSMAEFCDIPRETMRRKVTLLVERGWLERDAQGCLSVTPLAATDLEDATADTLTYLADLKRAFDVSARPAAETTPP